MNCTDYTYYVMLMVIASSIKIILPSELLPCTGSSQPGWFHVETYMHVLGLYFANTAAENHYQMSEDDR